MGRSIATLLTMLVTFAVLAALFVALDLGAGVRIGMPVFSSAAGTRQATPTPRPSATPVANTATPVISPTATVAVSLTATATPWATPPGGVSPPRYGTLLNYTNNTTFGAAFMETLDKRIIALTNQQRGAHGLAPLTESADLDIIAAARSQDLVKRNYFDHYDPTGPLDASGHRPAAVQELLQRNAIAYAEVGENLIGNTGFPLDTKTAPQVVQAWMRHPEHRANILHASYTTIGVGMAAEMRPDGLRVVITQVFIR